MPSGRNVNLKQHVACQLTSLWADIQFPLGSMVNITCACFLQWCVMVEAHTSICLNPFAVLQRQRVGCPCDCMSENVLFVMTLLCCSGD